MKIEIRISGLGGQGVVLAGQVLGRAAVYDGKSAVQTQSYGAEARGSIAKSEVIISEDIIGYPAVRKCDVLLTMSQEALDSHIKDLKENGVLMIDSTNVKEEAIHGARTYAIPASQTAKEILGSNTSANMVMLGALVKTTGIVSESSMLKAISQAFDRKAVAQNEKAFRKGMELIS